MTTRTSRLVILENQTAAAPESDAHDAAEICPTCGQRLAAAVELPLLSSAVCPNEHEKDQT